MTERIRVQYGRKTTQQLGTDFETAHLGGEWEFDVPDGADIQAEYGKAYAVIKEVVEGFFDGGKASPKVSNVTNVTPAPTPPARTMPGESFARQAPTPSAEPTVEIMEGNQYEFQNQRVWEVRQEVSRNNKQYVIARVGNKGGDIPPKGYARVKSYNPYMISRLSGLQPGDYVDITGVFEGWEGRDGRQYDFVPTAVEKVRDVRAS